MNDFFYFLIAGAFLMTIPIFVIAYFQAGFFMKWLKAKGGRGKYILIKVRSTLRDYFEAGTIKDGYVIYGKGEQTRRILIGEKSIYRAWGVACVDIDENTGGVCQADYSTITGFDAERFESLLIRALYRPNLEENKDKIILILVVVAIAAAGVAAILGYVNLQEIGRLQSTISGTIQSTIQSVV